MDHPMVYGALSQSTYSTVVYVAYPWVTQWCTARIALSQSTVVYVAYLWVTQRMFERVIHVYTSKQLDNFKSMVDFHFNNLGQT